MSLLMDALFLMFFALHVVNVVCKKNGDIGKKVKGYLHKTILATNEGLHTIFRINYYKFSRFILEMTQGLEFNQCIYNNNIYYIIIIIVVVVVMLVSKIYYYWICMSNSTGNHAIDP